MPWCAWLWAATPFFPSRPTTAWLNCTSVSCLQAYGWDIAWDDQQKKSDISADADRVLIAYRDAEGELSKAYFFDTPYTWVGTTPNTLL